MKSLLRVFLIIAGIFIAIFIVMKLFGLLTIADINAWFEWAKNSSPIYIALIVIALLTADIVISTPTIVVISLAGYFLGPIYGAMVSLAGICLSGLIGYGLSRVYGDRILKLLIKSEAEQHDAISQFDRHGVMIILLSRALPMLPETSACLSGMTNMPFIKFFTAWFVSTCAYTIAIAYAGSVSEISNPLPAIFTAIGISAFLWLSWFLWHRYLVR